MADLEPGSDPFPNLVAKTGLERETADNAEAPTLEETAALTAVLALMQPAPLPVVAAPRTSAWARAGRREAVRPWPERE